MTKGKICSQTSHATLGLYKDCQREDRDPMPYMIWASLDYPQETLKATSYNDLVKAQNLAQSKNMTANICHDAGRTQVDPMTGTVCAIGPASYGELKDFLE